jgi:hypothetical protein
MGAFIELRDLEAAKKVLTVEVQVGDGSAELEFWINPNKLTPQVYREFMESGESENTVERMTELMPLIVTGWNLQDNDVMVPVTSEALLKLSLPIINEMITAIMGVMVPNRQTEETPSASSEATQALPQA